MVNIKIKKTALMPLIKEGIYDLWLINLKKQWNFAENKTGCLVKLERLEQIKNADELISVSFTWSETHEQHGFWQEYSLKFKK